MTQLIDAAADDDDVAPVDEEPPESDSPRAWWTCVGIISLVGLAIRVWGVLGYRPPCHTDPCKPMEYRLWGDSVFYTWQGKALAHGYGFIDPVRFYFGQVSGEVVKEPTANHPPLYGLYLAAVSVLRIGESITTHRLASCVLGVGTVIVLAILGRKVAGPLAGLCVGAVAALYPAIWVNDYMLMSETMAAFATAVALLASYSYLQKPDARHALLMGAGLGLAALSRAEVALLFPLVALPFCWRSVSTWTERLKQIALVGAAAVVVLGPWVGYNLTRFEEPTTLSTGFGPTLSAASCDLTYDGEFLGWYGCGYQADAALTEVTVVPSGQTGPEVPGDESQREKFVRKYAVDYVKDHLEDQPRVAAARVGRLWYLFRPAQTAFFDGKIEGRGLGAAEAVRWSTYAAGGLAIYGMVVMWRRRISILPVLALILTVSIAAAITFGVPRYRVPADVGIALAAGIGIAALIRLVLDRPTTSRGGPTDATPEPEAAEPATT